jgi:hypothetical protein
MWSSYLIMAQSNDVEKSPVDYIISSLVSLLMIINDMYTEHQSKFRPWNGRLLFDSFFVYTSE